MLERQFYQELKYLGHLTLARRCDLLNVLVKVTTGELKRTIV
jgi:hypothetical protein